MCKHYNYVYALYSHILSLLFSKLWNSLMYLQFFFLQMWSFDRDVVILLAEILNYTKITKPEMVAEAFISDIVTGMVGLQKDQDKIVWTVAAFHLSLPTWGYRLCSTTHLSNCWQVRERFNSKMTLNRFFCWSFVYFSCNDCWRLYRPRDCLTRMEPLMRMQEPLLFR